METKRRIILIISSILLIIVGIVAITFFRNKGNTEDTDGSNPVDIPDVTADALATDAEETTTDAFIDMSKPEDYYDVYNSEFSTGSYVGVTNMQLMFNTVNEMETKHVAYNRTFTYNSIDYTADYDVYTLEDATYYIINKVTANTFQDTKQIENISFKVDDENIYFTRDGANKFFSFIFSRDLSFASNGTVKISLDEFESMLEMSIVYKKATTNDADGVMEFLTAVNLLHPDYFQDYAAKYGTSTSLVDEMPLVETNYTSMYELNNQMSQKMYDVNQTSFYTAVNTIYDSELQMPALYTPGGTLLTASIINKNSTDYLEKLEEDMLDTDVNQEYLDQIEASGETFTIGITEDEETGKYIYNYNLGTSKEKLFDCTFLVYSIEDEDADKMPEFDTENADDCTLYLLQEMMNYFNGTSYEYGKIEEVPEKNPEESNGNVIGVEIPEVTTTEYVYSIIGDDETDENGNTEYNQSYVFEDEYDENGELIEAEAPEWYFDLLDSNGASDLEQYDAAKTEDEKMEVDYEGTESTLTIGMLLGSYTKKMTAPDGMFFITDGLDDLGDITLYVATLYLDEYTTADISISNLYETREDVLFSEKAKHDVSNDKWDINLEHNGELYTVNLYDEVINGTTYGRVYSAFELGTYKETDESWGDTGEKTVTVEIKFTNGTSLYDAARYTEIIMDMMAK